MLRLLLAVAVAAASTQAAVVGHLREASVGQCPETTEITGFDPVPYLGRWYEVERSNIVYEVGMDCVVATYSALPDNKVQVTNTARNVNNQATSIEGVAEVIDDGVLLVTFAGHFPAEYHILDTDYENFSSVYNCVQEGELRTQYAWILSRTPVMDDAVYQRARQAFADNSVDLSLFHATYHGDDCPYPFLA